MNFPTAFTIAAKNTDYSLLARDVVIETTLRYLINATIARPDGRTLLSGWGFSATVKVKWVVNNPISDEEARESVRGATREIGKTMALYSEAAAAGEDHLLPLVTGLPLGCRLISMKTITTTPPRKAQAFLWDYVASVQDGFKAKLSEVRELVNSHQTVEK